MSRLAVISIVLSVLTIQASGKVDFALELLNKEIAGFRGTLFLGLCNFFFVFTLDISSVSI